MEILVPTPCVTYSSTKCSGPGNRGPIYPIWDLTLIDQSVAKQHPTKLE